MREQNLQPIYIATVTEVVEGGVKLHFRGELAPRTKVYSVIGATPSVNDRVAVAAVSGTYVVLGGGAGGSSGGGASPDGWIALSGTATYNSVDDPTGVINVPSGHGIEVGNRLKLTNAGNTIYGIVTAVTSTTVTFLHEINPSTNQALNLLTNSAITDVYYSRGKVPSGFPADPRKWTIVVSSSSNQQVPSPSAWSYKQAGSLQITVPIGTWRLSMKGVSGVTLNTSGDVGCYFALSKSLTSVSDTDLHGFSYFAAMGTSGLRQYFPPFYIEAVKTLASKTTFYAIMAGFVTEPANLGMRGDYSPTHIKAECAYL